MDSARGESVRTFGNDDSLPLLPLPDLEQTCARFMQWCAPLLTVDEAAQTQSAVDEFLVADGCGRALQTALEEYAATDGGPNWLDAFWREQYLTRREPVAVNANFFVLFKGSGLGQLERAAGLIVAALRFKAMLDDERVPPAIRRGQPLSMDQYRLLFSTTRIPGSPRDSVRIPGPANDARHVVVLFRGNLFRLDVLDPGGCPYPSGDLTAALAELMRAGARPAEADGGVGILTGAPRPLWAEARRALLSADDRNAQALDAVETALFCLSLEDVAPADPLAACDQLLHGDGRNRWFDKTLTFVVFANGRAGLNAEHTCVDGTAALGFVDALLDSPPPPAALPGSGPAPGSASDGPHQAAIEFVLDDTVRADIRRAVEGFTALSIGTVSRLVSIDGFGADQAKQHGVSPDAFAQMAFQLAYWRARGFVGSTYESIAMRHFRRGRTEALRVVTPEVVQFVTTMDDPAASLANRRAALCAAAAGHVRRSRECQSGQAPERHLAALGQLQRSRGAEFGCSEPVALYTTPGWLALRDEYLSTSTMESDAAEVIGFGPTTAHCIGICYRLSPDGFSAYLSAPLALADDLSEFAARLEHVVPELALLLRSDPSAG